ncbi:spermatogenesis-associated protein 19, mitochondrial [Sceloporus undulatus]|uniref:spermatogenesis-associated protein 19, mitochondrial n=1 Tax=Sceloporus undulatus TaxID=8520 RepID=UPI001C4CA8E6|nr:spermatogenesis-associated protein 19, mitochondrial [Sceloporus undulatus]
MIITTWTAFVVFRKATGPPFPSFKALDNDVIETEAVSVLEHWLKKIEQESAKIFRQKSENRTDSRAEAKYDIRTFPSLSQDLVAARSKPEPWESFEDRRPRKGSLRMSSTLLSKVSSHNMLDDRLATQFNRWSQTRVYRVTSDMRKDAMQERLDKVRNSISRVMFEAIPDTDNSPSDTSIHSSMSNF